jgi:hypothetical protein
VLSVTAGWKIHIHGTWTWCCILSGIGSLITLSSVMGLRHISKYIEHATEVSF